MKWYLGLNGLLASIILLILACIVADVFGVNLPHAAGSQLRLQLRIGLSDAREWSEN